MQIQSRDSQSCTDVSPRFAWDDNSVSVGFACDHGTVLWVTMNLPEAAELVLKFTSILKDITKP